MLGPKPMMKMARDLEKRCSRAVELSEDLVQRYPAVPEYKALLARARQRLGLIKMYRGKQDEAVRFFEQAEKLAASLARRFPASGYRLLLGESRLGLGEALRYEGKTDRAVRVLRQSINELTKVVDTLSRPRFGRELLARHWDSLARSLERQGKRGDATKAREEAKKLRR